MLYYLTVKTILFLSNAPTVELAPIFRGIHAAARREWNIQRIGNISNAETTKDILAFWKPDGCIIQCATRPDIFPSHVLKHIPVVYIDRDPALHKANDLLVMHDSAETGRIAAQELLSLGLEHFAYARASKEWFWCNDRQEAFIRALQLNGHVDTGESNEIDHDINTTHTALKRWLRSLPKPVGVFASNDRTAELVTLAANELKISIPQDLSIISVDNDEGICENTTPTLSSIAPEFFQAGKLAAELLARKFTDQKLKGVTLHYGQSGIVRRQSTRRLSQRNVRVYKIIEYLRLHAADVDFSFDQIAEISGNSLRCAEMHFKKLTGKTIQEELTEQRIERAKMLLCRSEKCIKEIGTLCGFSSVATFFRNFTDLTGVSPRKWRNGQRTSGE